MCCPTRKPATTTTQIDIWCNIFLARAYLSARKRATTTTQMDIWCNIFLARAYLSTRKRATTTTQMDIWCNIFLALVVSRFCLVKWKSCCRCGIQSCQRWRQKLLLSPFSCSLFTSRPAWSCSCPPRWICSNQEPFKMMSYQAAMQATGTYEAACHMWWLNLRHRCNPSVPVNGKAVRDLKAQHFKEPSRVYPITVVVALESTMVNPMTMKGGLIRVSPEELEEAFLLRVAEAIDSGASEEEMDLWKAAMLSVTISFIVCGNEQALGVGPPLSLHASSFVLVEVTGWVEWSHYPSTRTTKTSTINTNWVNTWGLRLVCWRTLNYEKPSSLALMQLPQRLCNVSFRWWHSNITKRPRLEGMTSSSQQKSWWSYGINMWQWQHHQKMMWVTLGFLWRWPSTRTFLLTRSCVLWCWRERPHGARKHHLTQRTSSSASLQYARQRARRCGV